MAINFTLLFKESWNFVRNQRQFFMTFVLIFVGVTWLLTFIAPEQPRAMVSDNVADDISMLVQKIVPFFISAWGLVAIHHISQGKNLNLQTTAIQTLRRFLGFFLLSMLCLLPLGLGILNGVYSIVQNQPPSFFAMVLIIMGIFVFVRFCLAPIAYLMEDCHLKNALPHMLKLTQRRGSTLFLYCLITHFCFPLLIFQLTLFVMNTVSLLLVFIVSAIINTFSLVLTYRFYTIFIQQANTK